MPAALKYVSPNDKSRPSSHDGMEKTERDKRDAEYKIARKYYEGEHKSFLETTASEPDDNVVINLVKQTVDREISFLFSAFPKFEIDPEETEETPDEAWIKKAFEYNGGLLFFHELMSYGALSGHVHALILKNEAEDYPDVLLLSPEQVSSYWKATNYRQVLWHEIYFKLDDDTEVLQDVYQRDSKWYIDEYTRKIGSQWLFVQQLIWPFKHGPLVHWKHLPRSGSFYGASSANPADVKLQDTINLAYSYMNRINRFHASPRTIITGAAAESVLPTAVNHAWAIENPEAKVFNLEMVSELQAAQQIALFLYDTYLSNQRTVILKGQVKDFQRVTNAGVQAVFMDQLAKNIIYTYQYGTGLAEIANRMSLAADGITELRPKVKFANPLPHDVSEQINVAAIERNMGTVSRETIATERGRNWDEELRKMRQEGEEEIFAEKQVLTNESNMV